MSGLAKAGVRLRVPALPLVVKPALAGACLATIVLAGLAIAAGAAAGPSFLVPAWRGGFPGWLSGPFTGLAPRLTQLDMGILLVAVTSSYLGAFALARHITVRWGLATIVGAHVVFLLSPPLLSDDVFAYISYARLGALHGLDPYTHTAIEAPLDPAFRFLYWRDLASAYGPLFTLGSYPLAHLGVAADLWVYKVLAAGSSLGCVALIWRTAGRLGRPRLPAAMLFGLNPLVLVYGVGGAHNDMTMVLLAVAGISLWASGSERASGAALVASVGIKASSALIVPFMVLGARRPRRMIEGIAVAGLAVAAVALAAFGGGALGFLGVVESQQGFVAKHAFPYMLSQLLGLDWLTIELRVLCLAGLLAAVAWLLVRTWRGMSPLAAAGWATVALLLTTAWYLPWYVAWLLPLAALAGDRRLVGATLALTVATIAVRLPAGLG